MARNVKAASMEIKTVGDDGIFEGYLSKFEEEDLEYDIVKRGAFTRTLKDKGPRRPLLWQHSSWEPVGVLEAKQDDVGLFIVGRINLDVQRGKEAHALVKQGAVTGLSQGFQTMMSTQRPTGRGRFLEELDLWEGSLATFPALPSARIMHVRSTLPPWMQETAAERQEQEQRTAYEARVKALSSLTGALRRA